jgi:hypothetical protein
MGQRKWIRASLGVVALPRCPWNLNITCAAVVSGRASASFQNIKMGVENGCEWDYGICYNGSLGGHLEILIGETENKA